MGNVGVLGSISIDNIFSSTGLPAKGERVFGHKLGSFVGGIGCNQARELSRYLHGVYFLGQTGEDENAGFIVRYLDKLGVCTDRLRKLASYQTGQTYMFSIDGGKDYFSIVDMGANEAGPDQSFSPSSWLENIDELLVSLEIDCDIARMTMEEAEKRGIRIWLSASPAECCTPEILRLADNLILNLREARMLLGLSGDTLDEIAHSLIAVHPEMENIVVSIGDEGALLRTNKGHVLHAPSYDVGPVIDPVGAGDALAGAFLAAKLNGLSDWQALCYGTIAGSLAVSVKGAQSSTHDGNTLRKIFEKEFENNERSLI